MTQLRAVVPVAFSAPALQPATPPDGTSLVELIEAFIRREAADRELVATHYQVDGATYTALLFVSEGS
jgi:hypothetical protein